MRVPIYGEVQARRCWCVLCGAPHELFSSSRASITVSTDCGSGNNLLTTDEIMPLDINLFRKEPDVIRESQKRRFEAPEIVDEVY